MKTRKKTKIIGQQKLFTADGEVIECQVVSIEDRDSNFHKIWLGHIIQSLDLIGNQKIRLANFVLQNLDKENKIVMTQRKIAEKSGISYKTVADTLKALQDANFLTRINMGAYQVNPDVLFKGGTGDRMNVLLQYHQAKRESAATKPTTPEEQLEAAGQTTILTAIEEQTATTPPTSGLVGVPKCPSCNKGHLETKDGKHGQFIGCTRYPECKFTESIAKRA